MKAKLLTLILLTISQTASAQISYQCYVRILSNIDSANNMINYKSEWTKVTVDESNLPPKGVEVPVATGSNKTILFSLSIVKGVLANSLTVSLSGKSVLPEIEKIRLYTIVPEQAEEIYARTELFLANKNLPLNNTSLNVYCDQNIN